jgi:hypothetical protein
MLVYKLKSGEYINNPYTNLICGMLHGNETTNDARDRINEIKCNAINLPVRLQQPVDILEMITPVFVVLYTAMGMERQIKNILKKKYEHILITINYN